jgi:hypothetical protein
MMVKGAQGERVEHETERQQRKRARPQFELRFVPSVPSHIGSLSSGINKNSALHIGPCPITLPSSALPREHAANPELLFTQRSRTGYAYSPKIFAEESD